MRFGRGWLLLALGACAAPEAPHTPEAPDAPGDVAVHADAPRLVPQPLALERAPGGWRLHRRAVVVADGPARDAAHLLAAGLRVATGFDLPVVGPREARGEGIVLAVDPDLELPAEGYVLDVDADGVRITGVDPAGLFWGTQTLRQLLPPESLADTRVRGVDWVVPAVHVEDAPRFSWRGFMLDVARHFFTPEVVERQIDRMALHKLNRLHLHLTDDQGWRLEIESWPRLAEVGGATEVDGGPGGSFTRAEFEALVAYAGERHVVIVPEIDFPGHAHAARASYAALNEGGEALEPYIGRPVISTPLWLDGPHTLDLVADVWREVAALVPTPWVHVGGDEAVGIDDAAYAGFLVWLQELLREEGKVIVGWDEVGGAPLEPPFVAQHWIDADRAAAAVARGGQLIASPASHAYLDHAHDPEADHGQRWAGYVGIERAYAWEPAPRGVDDADVLGVEGTLFTELVGRERVIDFMAWPRLAAHAEVGWSARDRRDWDDFRERLAWHGARLDALGVRFYRSPEISWATEGP